MNLVALGLLSLALVLPSAAEPRPLAPPAVASTLRTVAPAATAAPARRPPASLASLVPPAAAGPLRILLVDDDFSDNNHNPDDSRLSASDKVFRTLVAGAVGGDAAAWEVETVPAYKSGPNAERLRRFPLVVWYTGANYGGNPDNNAVLGIEDERAVRSWLEETGGAFMLFSPGYASKVLSYDSTWERSSWPFLREVFGVHGGRGLALRFEPATVTSADGAAYHVGKGGALETSFSTVNPDGAAVLFSAPVGSAAAGSAKATAPTSPVATAYAAGRGRALYVGFTFENLADEERAPAFGYLLAATALPGTAPAAPDTLGPRTELPPPVSGLQTVAPATAGAPPPVAPEGPAPVGLELTSSWPAAHSLRWAGQGQQSFEVHRRDADGWHLVKERLLEQFYTDRAFVAPQSAYMVVAVYADGRRGSATLEYPAPPQPQAPSGLRAWQTGPGTVRVAWQALTGIADYRVHGPGAPADGVPVGATCTTDLAGVPLGLHDVRVVARYGGLAAPVDATVKVAVNPDRGRYRLVLRGFQALHETQDDLLELDGKRDEVYAAAFWATAPTASPSTQAAGAAQGGGFARTRVFGDTQGFPDRIRAGTGSQATGGIRSGDQVPDASMRLAQAGVAVANDQLPLLLWEGELTNDVAVAVLPILFEWDQSDHTSWDYWANYWSSPGNVMQNLGIAMRSNINGPVVAQPLHGIVHYEAGDRPQAPEFRATPGRDRPIGLSLTTAVGQVPGYAHVPRGFVLTQRRAEASLAGQPAVALSMTWTEYPSELAGSYEAHFQLERLSEAPLVAPTPPPAVTATALPPAVPVMVLAAATPTPPEPTRTRVSASDLGQQSLEAPTPAPAGPPPTGVRFTSENAARHTVAWNGSAGATYDVFRLVGDRMQLVAAASAFTFVLEKAFVPPGSVYEVVARYQDGREGRARATFASPPQPAPITGLRAEQTGDGKLKVTWQNQPNVGARGFRVFSPAGPADGLPVPVSYAALASAELTGLPVGDSSIRVAMEMEGLLAPGDARLTATVDPWSGTYRVVLLGFRVQRASPDDDLFGGDGAGDEVFVGAYRASVPLTSNRAISLGFARSVVMGDSGRFSDRVRAGSASATGGLASNDVVPSDASVVLQPGVAAAQDRLPLLLWEGLLVTGGSAVAVVPVAFEWDDAASTMATWNRWQDWWATPNGAIKIGEAARAALTAKPDEIRRILLTDTYPGTYMGTATVPIPYCPEYRTPPGVTRPLGLVQRDDLLWLHPPYGLVLTRANVEKTLGPRPATVMAVDWRDEEHNLGADYRNPRTALYTAYLQIERLGPPPSQPQ